MPGWRDANDPKPLLAGEHDDVIKQGLPGVELPQATFDQCFPQAPRPAQDIDSAFLTRRLEVLELPPDRAVIGSLKRRRLSVCL